MALIDSGEIDLQRRKSLNTESGQEGQLTSWYGATLAHEYETSTNHGESVAFDEALVQRFTGIKVKYNKMLILGMVPKQHTAFQSDSEKSLVGTTVTSISFGSTADMMFQVKDVVYRGKTTSVALFEALNSKTKREHSSDASITKRSPTRSGNESLASSTSRPPVLNLP